MLALFLKARAQNTDTLFRQREVPKTEIEAVFSYYDQTGNHSAVTGGTGTEKLNVYATSITIKRSFKGYNKLVFNGGSDIISSASTDKIDDVVSSASLKDGRTFANIAYQRNFKKTMFSLGGGSGFSIESDYLSIPLSFNVSYTTPDGMRTHDLDIKALFDDLRWGRLNPDYHRPVKLIYPNEINTINWFDIYRRNTFSVKYALTQIVNKQLIVALFPEVVYQKGLLSTPFHRVYFADQSLKVENLPDNRLKLMLGFKANYFTLGNIILKAGYSIYWDSFDILANSFDLETPYKIKPLLILSPFVRIYKQSPSGYFKPYMTHNTNECFYTSDYDLSKLTTLKTGMGIKFRPNTFLTKNLYLKTLSLRYAWYKRSDHLNANIVTAVLDLETASRYQLK